MIDVREVHRPTTLDLLIDRFSCGVHLSRGVSPFKFLFFGMLCFVLLCFFF